jgi:hypothetical protein
MAKRPRDTNQLAKFIVDLSTGEASEQQETPRMKSGRAGGLKGGKTRMEGLSAEQRRELAKRAAAKRWKKPAPSR